ncbi:MAG: FAD-binding oxidoreductase [Candidatus Dormibacteraeota bacterium]|nr:FAD-binding oxidoreductase [Candidatus Dormibacteraeota bacterium]
MARRRKFWGWGYEDEDLGRDEKENLAALLAARFGGGPLTVDEPPALAEITLRPPRVEPPASLRGLLTDDTYERAGHTYGKSYRDVVRAYRRDFSPAPDWVALPRDEMDVAALLEWAGAAGLVAIPYGGGSSVVGGVEAPPGETRPVVSIDLRNLDRVVEVDRTSRAARIQAGALGPGLEGQLKPHELTLRHFPQSFELSTLGGWIATRSGGHFATLYTHIDDFVESLRVVTPRGLVETRRLPGDGSGPRADRLFLGSEGTLGIITEAWVRLQDRPLHRANLTAEFERFEDAVAACRAVAQAGLYPSNCRLLDPSEALYNGAGDGTRTLLLVAFESADHPLDAWIGRAAECCRDHGGQLPDELGTRAGAEGAREGSAGAWRNAFIRMPYYRDAIAGMGVINETFETACTWDRFEAFNQGVTGAVRSAMDTVGAGKGWVSLRFTHVYPDGPAPYYSVTGPAIRGEEIEQWQVIKEAASAAIIELGGTITHHHAVGRDHATWYRQEQAPLYLESLRAMKSTLDPDGILNPGVLFT